MRARVPPASPGYRAPGRLLRRPACHRRQSPASGRGRLRMPTGMRLLHPRTGNGPALCCSSRPCSTGVAAPLGTPTGLPELGPDSLGGCDQATMSKPDVPAWLIMSPYRTWRFRPDRPARWCAVRCGRVGLWRSERARSRGRRLFGVRGRRRSCAGSTSFGRIGCGRIQSRFGRGRPASGRASVQGSAEGIRHDGSHARHR